MHDNPSAQVRFTDASPEGNKKGKLMAASVKEYLVKIFKIAESRITTEGRLKPGIHSEQPGGQLDLELLSEGDRRVSIWSESPAILMEFQIGAETPRKPVIINNLQEAPTESYASFNVDCSNTAYTSWALDIADENGKVQNLITNYLKAVLITALL